VFGLMTDNIHYMQRAFYLARKGGAKVAPNPMVGAVLVYKGRIIGEGWHQEFGQAHAEVNCVQSVGIEDKDKIKDSTLYVSLEPCAHYGKTPPCASLIIEQGIKKVVIACQDIFSKVAGKGIQMLRDAGVDVTLGVLEDEAIALNKRFFTFHRFQRPYITLKWAESADGYIAPTKGQKVMLSNELVQRYVHQLRTQESSILVGYNTALLDNPILSDRFFGGPQPLRLVIDLNNDLPENLHIKTDGAPTVIFNQERDKHDGSPVYVQLNRQLAVLPQIMSYLYQQGINSLLVEGGTQTLQMFIDEGFWDEAHIICTQKKIMEGTPAPILNGKVKERILELSDNLIHIYKPFKGV
jgi:diaminohydroxyphosphoribosylaminopyrimidine deaminase/5-amino-6-(5-phosphoribosylamino)uracil reductase